MLALGKIYALARKVRVWLGPATEQEIEDMFPIFDPSYIDDRWAYSEIIFGPATSSSPIKEKFFSHTWFTRRLVLQEVILASIVIVHLGHNHVRWDDFHERVELHDLQLSREQREYGPIAMQAIETIRTLGGPGPLPGLI